MSSVVQKVQSMVQRHCAHCVVASKLFDAPANKHRVYILLIIKCDMDGSLPAKLQNRTRIQSQAGKL